MLDTFFFGKHLEDDENVSLIVHRTWAIGINALVWPFLLFALGWVLFAIAPVSLMLYITLGWSVFTLQWLLRNFFDYYLDAWIVTDHGIIALSWEGWFHRQSTRILFSDLQGVSYEIKGIIGTLGRFGTISIEKLSTGATVSLPDVSQPKKVETIILRNMEAYLHKKNLKNAKHVQELLAEFVAEKVQMGEVSVKNLQGKSDDERSDDGEDIVENIEEVEPKSDQRKKPFITTRRV